MYFWFLSKQGINNSILVRWVALLALLISMQYTSAATADIYLKPAVIGTIDSLEYDRTHQQLHIHGWVWDSVSAQPAAKLRVAIRDEIHEIDSPVQIARQDVQAVQGIPLVETGFSATAALHQPVLGGSYPVEITAIFTDGRAFRLPAGDNRTPLLQVKEVVGAIDSLMYEDFHHQLEIHGWVWDSVTAQPAVKLRVSIQGQNYELKPLTAVVRKDVQVALDIPLQASGFSATVVLHKALSSGVHPVAITAFLADGRSFEVLSGHEDTPLVQVDKPRSRHWVLLVLVLVWIALAYVPRLRLWGDLAGDCVQCHPRCISIAIGVTFVLLVAMGITGSSWQLLSKGVENGWVQFQGSSARIFKLRDIRSDQWSVLTPNTLAQWNHHPPFPVVNTNLGLEGQNMGVIGMTGTPIAQPAALGRLATWGYFFLPLQQAMSWHWQLPFFACLFFLWKALDLLRPSQSGFNFLLSTTFCVAPYAAGWSLWPLYATFFPLALFAMLAALLQTNRLLTTLWLGAAMGILLSGWVLVLYPPWQITIGTFMAFLTLGWLTDHRSQLRWRHPQWLGLALALLITAVLVGSWWLDTADAVAKIRATVYPGARTALQGADIVNAPWWTLRGYLNPEALTFGLGPGAHKLPPTVTANQSEISSYILLPLPIFLLSLRHGMRTSSYRWTLRACMAFIAFWMVFRFIGVPLWLAKITFWSYVTSARLDLVIALVYTVLLALGYASWRIHASNSPESKTAQHTQALRHWTVALCVALASAGLVLLEFKLLPPWFLNANSPPLQLAMIVAIGYASWWMMRGYIRAATTLVLLLGVISTLGFNPISQAPRSVQLAAPSAALVSSNGQLLRTLVISDGAKPSMQLVATGVPTVTGVFYYPHEKLWQKMGLAAQDWPIANRYQHLSFSLTDDITAPAFGVSNSQGDTVIVTVNPRRFDFSRTGAQRVVAKEENALLLRGSPSLTELGHHSGWFWFSVHTHGLHAESNATQ